MPDFQKGGTLRAPFGPNEYLRSTKAVKKESGMCAQSGVPSETIDGDTCKVLQPGTIMCAITSGADTGLHGVYDTGATDGREDIENFVGINDTFLPWTLLERDCEIALTYDATVVQAWCFEYASGVKQALSNTTRDAILALATGKGLQFK